MAGAVYKRHCLIPGGFFNAEMREISEFSHADVSEHVRYSWFEDYGGGRHPWAGENKPEYSASSDGYSFVKAPRYKGKVVQLGPLAELVIAGGSAYHFVFQNRRAKYVAPPVHPATSASGRSQSDGKASEGDNSESRGTNIHEVGAADRGNGIWNQCCAWKSGPLA